jgi:hypothetical protein
MTQESVMAGLSFLESLIDEMVSRAIDRHAPRSQEQSGLWVEGPEAVQIMGAGYTLPRLKEMGRRGEVVMDRKDPEKPNSPYIFLRSSLYDYNARRITQIDQRPARTLTVQKGVGRTRRK